MVTHLVVISLKPVFFSNVRQKKSESGEEGRWVGTGKSNRKVDFNQNVLHEKRMYFQ